MNAKSSDSHLYPDPNTPASSERVDPAQFDSVDHKPTIESAAPLDDDVAADLREKTSKGFLQTFGSQMSRFAIQIVALMSLARLLTPQDFGLVAMVLAIIGVGELFRDLGLSTAALQAKVLTTQQRDNLWWINASVGLALSLLTIVAAPLIAWIYHQPQVLIITIGLSPMFFLSGLQTQYRVSFMRDLRFGALALIDIFAALLGLVTALLLAWSEAGYWAIVAQTIIGSTVAAICLAAIAGWRPQKFQRGVGTKAFLRLGITFLGGQIVTYFKTNVDAVVIGRYFGTVSVGLYNRASSLVKIPIKQFQGSAGTVLLPGMSRVQDDPARLQQAIRIAQVALGYPIFAAVAVVFAAAQPLVALALGTQWSSAADFAVIIAIAAGLNALSAPIGSAIAAKGLAKELLSLGFLSLTVMLITVSIGGWLWGARGVAWGTVVQPFILWPVPFLYLQKLTGIRTADLIILGYRIMAAGGIVSFGTRGVLSLLPGMGSLTHIAVTAGLMLVIGGILAVIPVYRRDYGLIISLTRDLLRK